MAWNLPPGVTDRHIDEASPGYYDEPETEPTGEPEMKVILDSIELSMLRDKLARNNIGRFHLTVTATGDTNGGGTLLEFQLGQYNYGADTVKGADLSTVLTEFLRRFGWQQEHDAKLLPNYSEEEAF